MVETRRAAGLRYRLTKATYGPVVRNEPVYLVIRYPVLLKAGAVFYSAPVLVETYDYLKFYLAGCSDNEPVPFLGYEVLHHFRAGTSFLHARTQFVSWRTEKIHRWVTDGAYLTN